MGKIIRNGIEYSGSYDNAISINYDNTNSGLNATTVQEGIDEIKEDLKPHANVNPIANLLTTETGYALDATQGKVLNDKISAVSNSLRHEKIPSNINSIVGLIGLVENYRTMNFYEGNVTQASLTDFPTALIEISAQNLVSIDINKNSTFAYIKINACKSNGEIYTIEGLYNGNSIFWSNLRN